MSSPRSGPLSVSEKTALLSSILCQAWGEGYPEFLLRTINNNNITPVWDELVLPKGRSLRICKDYLNHARGPSSAIQLSPYGHHQYAQPGGVGHPSQKRSFSEFEVYQPSHRPLQPAPPRTTTDSPVPPTTNGESLNIPRAGRSESVLGGVRKKRGRPSKEEAAERDRALAAEGKTYEPRKKPSKKLRPSVATPTLGAQTEGEVPSISSRASTPPQIVEPREETSSGKRRVRRLREGSESAVSYTRLPPLDTSSRGGSVIETHTQSPSDRLLARSNERLSGHELTNPVHDDTPGGYRPPA